MAVEELKWKMAKCENVKMGNFAFSIDIKVRDIE